MNSLIRRFFQEFKRVRFLSEEKKGDWDQISLVAPDLPRGWFELSRLTPSDRVCFVRDHWLKRLPFHPIAHAGICEFFSRLDDIGVVLSAKNEDEELSSELLYSFYDDRSFFRGLPPANGEQVGSLYDELGVRLPEDYLTFLQIHNGFGKLSSLGLFPLENIAEMKERVSEMILRADQPVLSRGKAIDPASLLPFYEEEGLFSFQCFFTDWYPLSEMGNVYLSGIDYTISDTSDRKAWRENLAFTCFLEWLSEYLEGVNLSP